MTDLKPCPFCGEKAREVCDGHMAGFVYMKVECTLCSAQSDISEHPRKKHIDQWNARALETELTDMLIKIRDHEFGFSKGQVDENKLNQLIKKARGEI